MSKTNVKIEKNIPPPERNSLGDLPLLDMEIGDSIQVPIEPDSGGRGVQTLRQRISRFQTANKGYRFTVSKDPNGGGMRVWRVM